MKIAAVSYLNTLPFIYGIEQVAPELLAGLSLQIPSRCADEIIHGRVDVALVPVAAIPQIAGGHIITDYCIGAEGDVHTVVLLSNSPIDQIRTIYLDSHSRTSVVLCRLLAREWWKIRPLWVDGADSFRPLEHGEAVVAIGDKVFEIAPKFQYCYDLAGNWSRHTGLPFVFAAWVARSEQGLEVADRLNAALRYGVEHIPESITDTVRRTRDFDFATAHNYLTNSIKFNLDTPKQSAMKLFWEKIITPG